MSSLLPLSAQPLFHRLVVTLLQFLWQGAAVAALYGAARTLLPRSKAAARYAAGCAALTAMLALPAATFWQASWGSHSNSFASDALPAPTRVAPSVQARPAGGAPSALEPATASQLRLFLRRGAEAAEPWILLVWIAGVALLSARFLIGWAAVDQLRRRWTEEAPAALVEAFDEIARRLAISRPVRLLQSAAVGVPTTLGLVRPVVLFPFSCLLGLSANEIEALLAHELAHVRRHDYLVNLLQTVAETLLFYHPAVWWVSTGIRAERENCCDDLAVGVTGDARRYARALLRLEQSRAATPELALAASGGVLWKRVARLLPSTRAEGATSRSAAASLAVAALITLGAAARIPSVPEGEAAISDTVPALSDAAPALPPAPASPPRPAAPPSPAPASLAARPAELPASPATERGSVVATPPDPPSALEEVQSATGPSAPSAEENRNARLAPDQLDQFRRHGVTPEFLRAFEALGYTKSSADTLLSLRIHGVSPEFARQTNDLFGSRLTLDQLIDLRIHGVTPEYVRGMFAAFGRVSPDQAEALRIHGVSAEYLSHWSEAGYAGVSVDDAIAMRNHGVDPRAALEFSRLGLGKPSLAGLLAARIHGVTVEYVRGMREAGFARLDLDGMIALANHGVTPEFIASMAKLGLSGLSADQAITLRNHGVTPDFVAEVKALGYAALTVDELVALRNHGVSSDFIRKTNGVGRERLSVDELIDRRIQGREQR